MSAIDALETARYRQQVAWRQVTHATGRLARHVARARYRRASRRTARLELQVARLAGRDEYAARLLAQAGL